MDESISKLERQKTLVFQKLCLFSIEKLKVFSCIGDYISNKKDILLVTKENILNPVTFYNLALPILLEGSSIIVEVFIKSKKQLITFHLEDYCKTWFLLDTNISTAQQKQILTIITATES